MTAYDQPGVSIFQQANFARTQGDFENALRLYRSAALQRPALAKEIAFIIAWLQAQQSQQPLSQFWPQTAIALQEEADSFNKHILPVENDDAQKVASGDGLSLSAIQQTVNLKLAENGNWQASSNDPFFIFQLPAEGLPAGFYYWQLQLDSADTFMPVNAKLYPDYGQGFKEQHAINFAVPANQGTARWVYFSAPVRQLRFDPAEIALNFALSGFSLAPFNSDSAQAAITKELLANSVALPPVAEYSAINLYAAYDAFVKNRVTNIDYSTWITHKELPLWPNTDQVAALITGFANQPLISVVMPTYNSDEFFLRQCIESVLQQSYPNWELCIADDCSPKPHVVAVLQEYAARDARIKFVRRSTNDHISLTTNSALELASGDFVALLDHDDLLAEHALLYMARAINANPQAQIFYSDEDKIDEAGRRSEPHFKGGWNLDLFFSQNYVSHLGVYKRTLLQKIGGFRAGVEGAQDQDLLLRCLPYVDAKQVIHVPHILYHWRMLPGSTALASGEKSYTTEAGIKALTDFFAQQGPAGIRVSRGQLPNTYRVQWPLPAVLPKVSLLIPTRDRKALTEVAVRSILEKTTYPNYHIVILDNGSVEPETLAFFAAIQQADSRVRVLRYDHPFNYSAINNFGAANSNGEILGLINNDIEVINPDWLTEMVSHAIRPDIGCVGAKLHYSDGRIQHAGVVLGLGGVAGHGHKLYPKDAYGYFARLVCAQNYAAVTAAVLLVRRELFEKVGGLNETDLTVAFNDVDLCLKVMAAGYRNLWTPYAQLYHHESVSRGAEDTPEKQQRFLQEQQYMHNTWGDLLQQDPFYSPHLSKTREDFSIAL